MSIRPDSDYLAGLQSAAPSADASTLKVRYETFSPVEEYQAREGITEPLDEEFHAVLANDWRGVATVTANGITVKAAALVGPANVAEGLTYWHPDSDLCNRVASGPVKVAYTYNPARPEVLHLWSLEGRYLETLPAKHRAPILDNAALAEAAKHARRQIKKFSDYAQSLHHSDTRKALDELSHNASVLPRVAVDLPLPDAAQPQPRRNTPADRAQQTGLDGFDAARRDTAVLLEQSRQTRALADQADADLVSIRSRRASAPVAAGAYDPLDDL